MPMLPQSRFLIVNGLAHEPMDIHNIYIPLFSQTPVFLPAKAVDQRLPKLDRVNSGPTKRHLVCISKKCSIDLFLRSPKEMDSVHVQGHILQRTWLRKWTGT